MSHAYHGGGCVIAAGLDAEHEEVPADGDSRGGGHGDERAGSTKG
jgi:hypothetical protein